jgi:integrase
MKTHDAQNERIKRDYLAYLKEGKGLSEASLDGVAKALSRFEVDTRFRDFKAFHTQQAVAFKRRLAEQANARTGERLSKATLLSTLAALRAFFMWLAGQPGYRSKLSYADADYFNLSEKETRIAKAPRETRVPTLEQILHVIRTMPSISEIEQRDRALVAFTLLTGARDGATASLKLKHLDVRERRVIQDAREVRTKFSKTFSTYFLPVGDAIEQIVTDWAAYLRNELLWGDDDPLFPSTHVALNVERRFSAAGLARKHWSNATPIRAVFRSAFESAGMEYFPPHTFRKTLARLGEQQCRTPEEFKAWSQNLGHEHVMTTFSSYGEVPAARQAELIRTLARAPGDAAQALSLARAALAAAERAVAG